MIGDLGLEERESSGEGELSTVRANELVRKREREQDLNAVGPKKRLTQVQPVRPAAPTGQTGPAQTDRKSFGLAICRVSLN